MRASGQLTVTRSPRSGRRSAGNEARFAEVDAGESGPTLVLMPQLTIDIWSDVACPWCYVGKRRIEGALESFSHRDEVAVVWHSFELDRSAPRAYDDGLTVVERLAKKFGSSPQEAQARIDQLAGIARSDGLEMRFDRMKPGNTFDAHRVLHLAHERGLQDAVKERLFRGYFTEGAAIGEPEVLVHLAAEAGLDADEVRAALAEDRFADQVREDEALAARIGIRGVPFFVVDGKYAVSGAQPTEALRGVLERAWKERPPAPAPEVVAEGSACGPEGCA